MRTSHLLFILLLFGINTSSCQENNIAEAEKNKIIIQNIKQKMDTINRVELTEEEWKKKLSPEQYFVLREKGTERPWTGEFNMHFEKGKYVCAGCGLELFNSSSKFESHCGWPSFDNEIKKGHIKTQTDYSHGMIRKEIMCARCGGHLGHVFDDGPTQTGLRYCVNSLSIDFEKEK